MLKELTESLRPSDFRSSHTLFELPIRREPTVTLLLTCSDMAMNPFALIPTNVHNLYVLQNPGNLATPPDPEHDDGTEVENTVALYHAANIVVCGHSHCGVLRSLLPNDHDGLPSPFATKLRCAQKTIRIVAAHCAKLAGERLLTEAARVNVLVQLENLRAIPSIAARLDAGLLHLHGWLYTDGVITAYDPRRAEFVGLAQ